MTAAPAALLAGLVVSLADNKYLLGRRYAGWTNRAPALEAAVAAAAMTQDEMGHARSLYALLHSLPDSPDAYLAEERRPQLLAAPGLEQPLERWADLVAANVLFDRALGLAFEAARASRHEPLRQRALKIVQEERFHRQYGLGWLRRLAAEPALRPGLQAALGRFRGVTLAWLLSLPEPVGEPGLLAESPARLCARWEAEAAVLLADCGLALEPA